MHAILDTGHNVDYIDGTALSRLHDHSLLIIPPTQRMRLEAVKQLEKYASDGGKIIFIGETPSMSPGLADAKDSAQVKSTIASLSAKAIHVQSEAELPVAIEHALAPDLDVKAAAGAVGFIHRRLQGADVYFIANTSAQSQTFPLHTASKYKTAEWWNPEDGTITTAETGKPFSLEPYGSRLLILHAGPAPAEAHAPKKLITETSTPIELGHWTAEFPGSKGSPALPSKTDAGTVWTDDAAEKFYSGEVRFRTSFKATSTNFGEHFVLRFAEGKALQNAQPEGKNGMRAWYDAPLREAAIVYLNGKRAGSLWHPPYELDLTKLMHDGENTIEIRVYNTAINELAGQPPRNYTALKAKYGDRFQMQDMDNLQPVPSGIFGPVKIVREKEQ
jgi:hypothetical protein